MPGALTGVIKEVYPKRGVIEMDSGVNKFVWNVSFDRSADSLQIENLSRRYSRGDRVYFLAAGDTASLVCPKRESFEGVATVDYLQSHHGRGISKNGEVFFTLQRLTHYFKNTSKADLHTLLKLGDKIQYVAVKQPQSTTLKAITVVVPGKETSRPVGGLANHSRTVSPIQQREFEGMFIEVAGNHAYVWCLKLGFCFLPRSSCADMGVTESDSLVEVFVPGDWIKFFVINQKPKNNCDFRIQKICSAVTHEGAPKIECWKGREPSFNTECFMARGIGIVGAVPTLEYGILYSQVLGRVYFRSEFIRDRTMPKPLIAVQFTAFPDMENGNRDCGWRAIEVAPLSKDMRQADIPKPARCDKALVKCCQNNKSVLLTTKEYGDVYANCQTDFWIRIDQADKIVGKRFTVFVVPYVQGGSECHWRGLFVCPEEHLEKMFGRVVPAQPMPSPYPFPDRLPIHIPIPYIPPVGVQADNRQDPAYFTDSQLAALEDELSTMDVAPESENNSEIAEYLANGTETENNHHGTERSPASSGSAVSVENGRAADIHYLQSTIRVLADSEEVEKGTNEMVDEACQTVPSKERELLKKIMNNKDLFTACMVKFPDLVFEICMTESLLT